MPPSWVEKYAAAKAAQQREQTNQELAQSIQGNLAEAGSDPSILDRGLNVLGRGFDLLSRPLYGVAEATRDVVTGDDNPFHGLLQGVEGKKKTTFSTVLGDAGVEGPLRGILGLGLDVALDPTTYLTGGIVRGASEAAAHTAAGKIGAKAAARVATTAEEGSSRLAAALRKEFTIHAAEAGEKLSGSEFRAARRAFVRKGIDDAAVEEARKVGDSALQKAIAKAEKGRVELRFGDTVLGSSEKLYGLGSKVGKVAGETRVGSAINKGFRTTSLFSRELNPVKRRLEGLGLARAEQFAHAVRHGGQFEELALPAFKDLTEEESSLITHAIDTDTIMQELSTTGIPLEDYRQAAKSIFSKLGDAEEELGILDLARRPENYVPFRANTSKADQTLVEQIRNGRRAQSLKEAAFMNAAESPEPWMFTGEHSLAGAIEQLGPDAVVTDIRRLISDRIGESYRDIGRHTWNLAAAREFGVDLGSNRLADRIARSQGLQKVNNSVMGRLVKAGLVTENTYFPREIAQALRNADKAFFSDVSSSGLVNLYDKALQSLKLSQTAINPGHHIRNALTDITLNFLDGVVNPEVYARAAQIMRAQGKLAAGEEMIGHAVPAMHVGKLRNPVDGLQLWNEFVRVGGKSGFFRTETAATRFGVIEKIRQLSETREDWARFSHFLDALEKEGKNARNMREFSHAAERAGERVRKFNIDYGDLTPFEQRTMKRVVPFYTWMRKNVPLQIENMFLRPGRIALAPKLHRNIQAAFGTDDVFDVAGLNALPDWMRDAMYTALVGEGQGRNGTYWNPAAAFPQMDLANFFGGEGRTVPELLRSSAGDIVENQLAGLTPLLRVPIEATTGHNFYSGNDSNSPLYSQVGGQVPLVRMAIGNHENMGTKLLNYLTGLGVSNPTDANIRGELRSQQDIVQALLRRYYEAHPEITRTQRQDQVALQQFLQGRNS